MNVVRVEVMIKQYKLELRQWDVASISVLTCRRGGSKMASVNSVLSLSFLLG